MFILVRSKNQINKTARLLKHDDLKIHMFAISNINFHKVILDKNHDGIIVTSPNAVLAIPQTKLPFFCVGESTAKEAIETGRRVVFVGNNNAKTMAEGIAKKFPPETLIHAAGDMVDTSWYKILESVDIKVEKHLAYETNYTDTLDKDTFNNINNKLKAIVFFSVKGAEVFTKLLLNNNINLSDYKVIAFSENIAEKCNGYKEILISPKPTLDAVKNIMLKL